MTDVEDAVSAAFVAIFGSDPVHTLPKEEPTISFALLKEELSKGYGVEDIAVVHGLCPDHVRKMVAALRKSGRMHHVYPRRPKSIKPSFFAWIIREDKK